MQKDVSPQEKYAANLHAMLDGKWKDEGSERL